MNGMNERFSGSNAGTMFGDGNYFAEDGAKVDQYTRDGDNEIGADGLEELHKQRP